MNSKWQLYKALELIPDSVSDPLPSTFRKPTHLESLWRSLIHPLLQALTTPSPHLYEPIISQRVDRNGQLWWHAYDPITGVTTHLTSDDEVYIWLEQLPKSR